jgi:2-hydroxychromene-2-carboxylate isomerase
MGQVIDLSAHRSRRRPAGPPARVDLDIPDEAPAPTCVFDPVSPFSHLAIERIDRALPDAVWHPVDAGPAVVSDDARVLARERAHRLGARIVWPETVTELAPARRVALAAGLSGHGAAYAIALGRLTFSGGFDPGELTTLLEAGTAAGMDPGTVCRAALDESLDVALQGARTLAGDLAAHDLPAIRLGDRLFAGDQQLPAAIAYARSARGAIASQA